MKLTGSNNKIQGFFNHENIPEGAIYTKDDLVLHNSVVYVCLDDTIEDPDPMSPNWEYYLNSLSPVKNLEELELNNNSGNLVNSNAVREYLQSRLPGTNSDGSLKIITSGILNNIPTNSKFQLDSQFLIDLKAANPSVIPFTPELNKIYVISTIGDFNEISVYFQEIIELDSVGNTKFWYRSGNNISTAIWKTHDINTEVEDYLNYINSLVSDYNTLLDLYKSTSTNMGNEYNYWLPIDSSELTLNEEGNLVFTDTGFIQPSPYNKKFYYKLFLNKTEGGNKYKGSIDISPKDHSLLSISENLYFKDFPGVFLTKVQSKKSVLTLPDDIEIDYLLKSNSLNI